MAARTRKSPMNFKSMPQADVPQGRKGRHNAVVTKILSDLDQLSSGVALKVPLAQLADGKVEQASESSTRRLSLSLLILLTLIVDLTIMNYPGKFAIERWLVPLLGDPSRGVRIAVAQRTLDVPSLRLTSEQQQQLSEQTQQAADQRAQQKDQQQPSDEQPDAASEHLRQAQADAAAGGAELHGVVHQVDERLAQHHAVAERHRIGPGLHGQRLLLLLGQHAEL